MFNLTPAGWAFALPFICAAVAGAAMLVAIFAEKVLNLFDRYR